MATLNVAVSHHHPNSNPHYDPSKIRNCLLTPKPITLHPFPVKKNISTRRLHGGCLVPRSIQKPSENDNEPSKAPDQGLFASMKDRYLQEFLGLVGKKPPLQEFLGLVGNKPQILHYDPLSLLILQTLLKKQSTLVLSSLMAFIANHLELVVKPTTTADGPDVGIRWHFEWKNNLIPVGPLNSLYTTHVYTGRLFLRNGKVLFKPLLHLELLNKKMEEIVMPVLERILPQSIVRGERKVAGLLNCLLALFCMALCLVLWKDAFM